MQPNQTDSKFPASVRSALRERSIIIPFNNLKDRVERGEVSETLKIAIDNLAEKSNVIILRHKRVTKMLAWRGIISLIGNCDITPEEWIKRHNNGKLINAATDNLKHKCAEIMYEYRTLKRKHGHDLAEFVAGYPDANMLADKIHKQQMMLRDHDYRGPVALLAGFSDTPSKDADMLERFVIENGLESKPELEIQLKLQDACLALSDS